MKIRLRKSVRRLACPSVTIRIKRKPTLERALYMRPIRPSRIGHVNTNWSEDGWYRQGVPVGKSLILVLKCGHVLIVPQHPLKIRKLVYCPMCFMLWTERAELEVLSKHKQRKRNIEEEEIQVMAKKQKKSDDDRRGRKVFQFVKDSKDVQDGTIGGAVLAAIKKLRKGTVAEISEKAEKDLKEVTGQDPLTQTGIWLHRMAQMGAVKKVAADDSGAKKKSMKIKLKKSA